MIFEAIVNALTGFIKWMLNALPDVTLPVILVGNGPGTLVGMLETTFTTAAGFDPWLGTSDLVLALGFLVACVVVAMSVRVFRMIVSHVTGGGGSAA